MTVLRYPLASLIYDYLRSACGILVGGGIVLLAAPGFWVSAIFLVLVVVFLVFGFRTFKRQHLRLSLTEDALRTNASEKTLEWDRLEKMRLRYYGTQRERFKGKGSFLELKLETPEAKVSLESSLQGFAYLAWRAAKAARENGVTLDPTSAENLRAIGINADSDQPPPELDLQSQFVEAEA
jgi:hypothetical protein